MMNKLFLFFERKSINILIYIYILFMLLVLINNHYLYILPLDAFFLSGFYHYLKENGSELVTIATIFIGIYFSIYTILMSSSEESAFGRLSKRNKVSLIRILNKGFISSFAYVIFSLFYSVAYTYFPLFSSLIVFGLVILFFYSALVFGVDIFILIKIDIENKIK